jgi:hypothetical protein
MPGIVVIMPRRLPFPLILIFRQGNRIGIQAVHTGATACRENSHESDAITAFP